jgi:DivIVA domain-containing protein
VALDRQSIEKRDFPIGRRGYDPAAVDAHLSMLADELEAARRSSRSGGAVASAASEQVRLIVEAAEQSASDIERDADLEARRIRQEAREAAEAARSEAGTQARDHVARVSEAATAMLERLDAMDTELRGLLDGVRAGASRVSSDLSLLQSSVGQLRSATTPAFEPDPVPARAPAAAAAGAAFEPATAEPEPAGDLVDEPVDDLVDEPVEAAGEAGDDRPADEEGARLIAFNMALNGTPREETETYLRDNFDLEDADSLLDDVYAQAGL